MHVHFERAVNAKSDCSILSLSWMGRVPDKLPKQGRWKLNRSKYYQEGWLAIGNARGTVGVTLSTSHCKKNVDFTLRTNYHLRGHYSEVFLVKWNELYQKLVSCDGLGYNFVWSKCEGRWSNSARNIRRKDPTELDLCPPSPVAQFSWSHDGRIALICHPDGFVSLETLDMRSYWRRELYLEATITCGIWTPDDKQLYLGTTTGQIVVMNTGGGIVSQVQITSEGITSMAWSCEEFKTEEGDNVDSGLANATVRRYVLAVCLQNGVIRLLETLDDVSPVQIDTGLQGPLRMEWSKSRELLAVAGAARDSKGGTMTAEYINLLKFYNEEGLLLYAATVPSCEAPVSALTWGHNDKRLFMAIGTQIHIAWVSRGFATLQLLSRLRIYEAIQQENQLPALPVPAKIQNLIGNLFVQTLKCYVPETGALRNFEHCTMKSHDDDNHMSSGTYYTLHVEFLGGFLRQLIGKSTSKNRPEFVIGEVQIQDLPSDTESSESSSQSSTGGGLQKESSDSDLEQACTSFQTRDRQILAGQSNEKERAYIDKVWERARLVKVTSNIWGTMFKITKNEESENASAGPSSGVGDSMVRSVGCREHNTKRQSRQDRHLQENNKNSNNKSSKLKNCGKSKSLDFSDPLSEPLTTTLDCKKFTLEVNNPSSPAPGKKCKRSQSASSIVNPNCDHQSILEWNENSKVYHLDFGERTIQELPIVIKFMGKQVMQFERVCDNEYILDFQYPFSYLLAFAVALVISVSRRDKNKWRKQHP